MASSPANAPLAVSTPAPAAISDPSACYELKIAHDNCFYKWYYNEFLRGTAPPQQPCEAQFRVYRECVERKMKAQGVDNLVKLRAADERSLPVALPALKT